MAIQAKANAIFEATHERLGYLRDRWQDEQHYEDFAEYREAATKAILDAGGSSVVVSRGLLRVSFHSDGEPFNIVISDRAIELKAARGTAKPRKGAACAS